MLIKADLTVHVLLRQYHLKPSFEPLVKQFDRINIYSLNPGLFKILNILLSWYYNRRKHKRFVLS